MAAPTIEELLEKARGSHALDASIVDSIGAINRIISTVGGEAAAAQLRGELKEFLEAHEREHQYHTVLEDEARSYLKSFLEQEGARGHLDDLTSHDIGEDARVFMAGYACGGIQALTEIRGMAQPLLKAFLPFSNEDSATVKRLQKWSADLVAEHIHCWRGNGHVDCSATREQSNNGTASDTP